MGKIVSLQMEKTAVVEVETKRPHPFYKKIIKSRKKYFAHIDQELDLGDEVLIRETRPLSKNKKWVVVKKIEKKV